MLDFLKRIFKSKRTANPDSLSYLENIMNEKKIRDTAETNLQIITQELRIKHQIHKKR